MSSNAGAVITKCQSESSAKTFAHKHGAPELRGGSRATAYDVFELRGTIPADCRAIAIV